MLINRVVERVLVMSAQHACGGVGPAVCCPYRSPQRRRLQRWGALETVVWVVRDGGLALETVVCVVLALLSLSATVLLAGSGLPCVECVSQDMRRARYS